MACPIATRQSRQRTNRLASDDRSTVGGSTLQAQNQGNPGECGPGEPTLAEVRDHKESCKHGHDGATRTPRPVSRPAEVTLRGVGDNR
jgi:hypothetical protein